MGLKRVLEEVTSNSIEKQQGHKNEDDLEEQVKDLEEQAPLQAWTKTELPEKREKYSRGEANCIICTYKKLAHNVHRSKIHNSQKQK